MPTMAAEFPSVTRGPIALTRSARSLWGKSDGAEGSRWLPLYMHMLDSAGIAEHLWDEWLPGGTRSFLTRALGGEAQRARGLACFIAGVHDMGKATPSFQGMPCGKDGLTLEHRPRKAGLPIHPEAMGRRRVSHPVASHLILFDVLVNGYGWDARCARSAAAVVGTHHGKPPEAKDVPAGVREEVKPQVYGLGWDERCGDSWTLVQGELVAMVAQAVGLVREDLESLAQTFISAPAASLLTGFVIMADWLASDQDLFPLISNGYDEDGMDSACRVEPRTWEDATHDAACAWRRAALIPAWHARTVSTASVDELYRERFGFSKSMHPRPVQLAAVEAASSVETPGLMIIEAPMGEGKTEAALAAAEVLGARTGRGGVCIALPTMATTDAMFGRVHRWLDRLPRDGESSAQSMFLAHGKARLNEEFQGLARNGRRWTVGAMGEDLREYESTFYGGLRNMPDSVVVSQWMQGRKKGMLANFVVCTVDQVLMGALEMKHLPLRQLALANKVVVIDECHAYDAYMRCYLNRVLGWLGAMAVPVVLLSATLPVQQRFEMLKSYQDGYRGSMPSAGNATRKVLRRRANKPALAAAPAGERSADLENAVGLGDGAYPLITYTNGCDDMQFVAPEPSGRSTGVHIELLKDDDEALIALMKRLLDAGGCAGVICTTVTRAQHAARVLREAFGHEVVVLTHARFTDLDRMANETRLRDLLGPNSTRENGRRPERLIVVGTQVLEQSLDIDFDVMVSDVAPIDLVMQRLGRLHRHERGRPTGLATAACYLRGIKDWKDDGPVFADNVDRVYPAATLLEALGVLGMTDGEAVCKVNLPVDIARTVREAYGGEVVLPQAWLERYGVQREKRNDAVGRKCNRAGACLLRDATAMAHDTSTLVDWYVAKDLATRDQDYGPRAVRDTGETVEVLALELRAGGVCLLPWVGDEGRGVECGAQVDTAWIPDDATAQLAAQSAVRLPQSLCRPEEIEGLITELEETCGPYVGSWQESPWLAGYLPLLLKRGEDGRLSATLRGRVVTYDPEEGLVVG